MNGIWHDLRFGLRQLVKRPGFTAAAILTLTLGIGVNTAVFSLVNGYLLKPLPYPHSDRLVQINEDQVEAGIPHASISTPNYLSMARAPSAFSALAAYNRIGFKLTAEDKTRTIAAIKTTASLFDVLKVNPFLGHAFEQVNQQPGRARVTVLSYGLWQRTFGANPNVIGQTMRLDDKVYKIVGVMPKGFAFHDRSVDLWVPCVFTSKDKAESNRRNNMLKVIGRLKPGVSLAAANRQLTAVLHHVAKVSSQMRSAVQDGNVRWVAVSYHQILVGNRTSVLLLLQGAVLLVLLMTCVNVANLLLARILGRTREFAIRAALGGSRVVLARQLLVEGLCLTIPGGLLGLGLGWWSLVWVRQLGFGAGGSLFSISPDWRVGGFAIALAVLTAIVISILPIFHLTRTDLQSLLQEGGHAVGGGRGAKLVRNVLVVVELGLAVALLSGAGLLLHSFVNLGAVNPGFDSGHKLTASLSIASKDATNSRMLINVYRNIVKQMRTLPGVDKAGLAFQLPLNYGLNGSYGIVGQSPSSQPWAWWNFVSDGYFKALGLPILRGRGFSARDTASSQPVVVIDRLFAKKRFPHQNPVGHYITLGGPANFRIVGVVPTVKTESLASSVDRETIYLPLAQAVARFSSALPAHIFQYMKPVIKTTVPPHTLAGPLKKLVVRVAPTASISGFKSMRDIMADSVQDRQATMTLVLVFGAIALLLAVIGVYGVMSYSVRQRRHECGVRLALGATPRDLLWLIIGDGLRLLAVGLIFGLMTAVALGYAFSSQLFGVAPFDPITLGGVVVVLAAVTVLACYLPARAAARLDPTEALQN